MYWNFIFFVVYRKVKLFYRLKFLRLFPTRRASSFPARDQFINQFLRESKKISTRVPKRFFFVLFVIQLFHATLRDTKEKKKIRITVQRVIIERWVVLSLLCSLEMSFVFTYCWFFYTRNCEHQRFRYFCRFRKNFHESYLFDGFINIRIWDFIEQFIEGRFSMWKSEKNTSFLHAIFLFILQLIVVFETKPDTEPTALIVSLLFRLVRYQMNLLEATCRLDSR